MKLLEIKKDNS